jgi:hypothetical protein
MKRFNMLIAALATIGLGAQAAPAFAAPNWVGSADYTMAPGAIGDEEVVGPFSTYDFGSGGVALLQNVSGSLYNGYYQSYVTQHELAGNPVLAPKLNGTYELTAAAQFTENLTLVSVSTAEITINPGGVFALYFDTNVDRSFSGDSGFTNGAPILVGTITGGSGAVTTFGSSAIGVADVTIQITSYDTNVFSPDTIAGADGIFTLRYNFQGDAPLTGSVTSVQGVPVAGNLLFAADGNLTLAIPEPSSYAMLLAGLGFVGFASRRKLNAGA